MTDEAIKARREYQKAWRDASRAHVAEYAREWRKKNKQRFKEMQDAYWERKAAEKK